MQTLVAESLPLKQELQAIQNFALALEALQGVLTLPNFVENVPSYAAQDTKGNSTMNDDCRAQHSIVNPDSTLASSPTNELAEI